MSYTELEHGYQDLRSTSRPIFYVGDITSVQPALVDPVNSSLYRSSKRGELSDGCSNEDGCMGGSDLEGEGKQVLVGVCAMAKKSQSKPMKEILTRLEEFEYIKILVFPEEVILKEPVEDWPIVDCLISFHSKGFPLDKAIHYANLRNPFIINNLPMQYDIQLPDGGTAHFDVPKDRRRVYAILDSEGIEIPRYAVLDRDSADPKHHELVESEDHVEVNGVTFNKPFVEKPVSAEDHNIYIYYPTSAGGGSQRLFRKIGSRSSVYSPESRVRKTGSYIYEDFMPTDGTDVKVYTVGPDYAHAEARKSPALDGKVERDSEGKEIRYPVILSNAEKLISRKVCLAFKQTVCGFDLLRANGKSFVCDVNGFSFVKNSNKYYDDCAKILGNMILRELAPTLHIPWSVPFQLDDPPIVPTTFGKMMELRCVVAVIRHGDRTPKQKMKVEVRHPKFFEIFAKYDGYKHGHVKLKRPKQLQEILDTARSLLTEIQHRAAGPELEEKQGKLEQLKSVLEMYGHFSGINRKVQMKYQPRGRPRGSSSDDDRLGEPSLVLILKWGGELTPAGRIQAEELGRIFRCMYPGGQGRHLSEEDSEMLPSHGEYAGAQGLGLLRLHSTFRHDLKIYASDEGRVQMTAAAFAKGLLALEGELTPILVQMVKSANTNGLLDNDCDSSKYQNMVKTRLHELLQQDREFTREDREQINPGNALSINDALDFVKNPVKCCQHVQVLIQKLMDIVRIKKDDSKTKDAILYHGETWELMGRRWGKIEKDFCTKNKRFDISKIPDIYDCIKYDLQHNNHTLQFDHAEELYIYAKYLADIVIPQEYGLTVQEKMTIGQGICTPLLKKIRADLQRNIEEFGEETVNRLNPRYSHGVSSPGRHVRTRLYFTSESHVHSLLTVLRYGGLLDVVKDEQWRRAMEYVSMVSELNYMSQIVVMLYEDPTKDPSSEERFHVELHFSPGVNCCVQKNLPPGPGFRPHSRNESSHNLETNSQCSTRIDEEDAELGGLDDGTTSPQQQSDTSPVLAETEEIADTNLDSPTTSRAIDMMDLDPNMMDEPYDSGFLQASAPIPISARTVAGHEAARLGSQLAASQRQRREREASGICEPRARSYDHQRQEKTERTVEKLQYQSLDAVNKEDDQASRRPDVDDLFYERVESLVTAKKPSTRNIAQSHSPSCLGSSTSNSLSSSSPDLSCHLTDTQTIRDPSRWTVEKDGTQFDDTSREVIERKDFWDFEDPQLLEKSPIYGETKVSDEKTRSKVDERNSTSLKYPGRGRSSSEAFERMIRPTNILSSAVNPALSKTISTDRRNNPQNPREILSSTTVPLDPRAQTRFVPKYPAGSKVESPWVYGIPGSGNIPRDQKLITRESPEETCSSKNASPFVERSEPRETPSGKISHSSERNRSMTRSPSCLGVPVSLPHSVSSPELPAPVIETILESSGPRVTLANYSLATSLVASTSRSRSFERSNKTENILSLKSCVASNSMPVSVQASEARRYGRSKSALTLSTGNDPRGESGLEKITNPRSSLSCDRFPIYTSNCQSCFRHHCKIAKYPCHECCEPARSRNFCSHSIHHRAVSATGSKGSECTLNYSKSIPPCTNDEAKSLYKYSTSLPSRLHSCNRRNSLEVPLNEFERYSTEPFRSYSNSRRTSLIVVPNQDSSRTSEDYLRRPDFRFTQRSRSLSPCPQRCLCYNCNVSTLIQESVNLPPAERTNFERYFVRSLSHKFINCCCYRMSIESAKASRRVSRSASPNSTSSRESLSLDAANHSFRTSLPFLDLLNCPKYRYNRQLSLEPCSHRYSGDESPSSVSTIGSAYRRRTRETDERLERHLSIHQRLGPLPNDSSHLCRLQEAVPLDHSHLVGRKEGFSTADVDSVGKDHFAMGEMSDQSLTIRLPSSDIVVSSNDDQSHSNVEKTRSNWVCSLKSPELVAESRNVSPINKSNSTTDRLGRNVLIDNMTSNRRLLRQLSCPAVVTDSSSASPLDYPLSNDCDHYNCSLLKEHHFGQSTYGESHLPSLQSSPTVPSTGFPITDQRAVDKRSGRLLPRKFSCPEMIAESSSQSKTTRQKDMGTDHQYSERKYYKKSRLLSPPKVVGSRSERDARNREAGDDRTLGHLSPRKSMPRQVSCPEIINYFADMSSHSLLHRHDCSSKNLNDDECAHCRLQSLKPSIDERSCCLCTANYCPTTVGTRCKYPNSCCTCLCLNYNRNDDYDRNNGMTTFIDHTTIKSFGKQVNQSGTYNTNGKNPRHSSFAISTFSSSSHPRLQTQRSFSSPDTRPSIIQQPDPTCTARRHRHSISGQMSYFKLLGYNVSKKLTGSTNSLFSTAVISGSSSAPNLKDMVPPHASAVAAIEGFGGVPPIRPLETLHNALSLRQLDSFLDMMTNASLFRTPASSPPKFPSPGGSIHGGSVVPNLSICSINREYNSSDLEAARYITPAPMHYKSGLEGEGNDNRNQLSPTSPNSAGWSSEPQSFLSSGPSSPAPTSAGECSMSMSLVSNDGTQPFVGSKVSTSPCLDIDFNDFCRTIDQEIHAESRGSISYTDYYSNEDGLIRKTGPDLSNLREHATHNEPSQDSVIDDDEEHTLTLRETEESRKQDVKFIFDRSKDNSLVKPSSSYKKIGRFRVESMEISDEDVRIREAESTSASGSNISLDRVKAVSSLVREKSALLASLNSESQDPKKPRGNFGTLQNRSRQRAKTIARSQSVSTPQSASRKIGIDYARQTSGTNTGSFSTMSCEDLENWKLTAVSPPTSSVTSPTDVVKEEPILTLASSLKGSSNIVVGFKVQDDEKD